MTTAHGVLFRVRTDLRVRIPSTIKISVPLTKKRGLGTWLSIFGLGCYIAMCFWVFFSFVQPALNHESTVRVGADSDTYFRLAQAVNSGSGEVALVGLGTNLLGPILVALIFKTGLLVYLFNLTLFIAAVRVAASIKGMDWRFFLVFVILNAETLVSIVTLNKEIFALLSVTLLAKYIYSTKPSFFLLTLVLLGAMLARWEQLFVTLLFLFCRRHRSSLKERPTLSLALFVLVLTIAYPMIVSHVDVSGFTEQAENGGLVTVLNSLQAHFLYPIALIPKILMGLFGRLLTPWYFFNEYWDGDFSDLQNQYAGHLHTLATLFLCIATLRRGLMRLNVPLIFFSALYLALTSINPFVQTRYSYPVYIALCLALAMTEAVPEASEKESRSCHPLRSTHGFCSPDVRLTH